MNKTILYAAIAAASTFALTGVNASERGMANKAYVGDAHGRLVVDGSGRCVQTIEWTEALAIPGCDGKPVIKEEPKVEETVVEAAPVPAPAPAPLKAVEFDATALFDFDKDVIKAAGQEHLRDLAEQIKSLQAERIEVGGHTDSTGPAAYNQALSERRAAAVKDFLINQGVDADLISTTGYGMNQPVADNATAAGRAKNRRVEVTLYGKQ